MDFQSYDKSVYNKYRERQSARCRKILHFLLFFKKQHIFHLPSSFNARHYFAFVAPEGDILFIDIPVSGLQLLQQFAFGHFAVTFQTVCPHIIAQNSGDQLSKPKYYPNLTFYYIEYQ